ncbi:MAG TPA: alpha/beta hydrolase [Nitriliruptoraceae bacterium]|nr:alpha/beta hydrolase [Nitriliruptoraceae bacterium]
MEGPRGSGSEGRPPRDGAAPNDHAAADADSMPDREIAPCRLPDGRVMSAAEFGDRTGRPVLILDGAGSRLQGRLGRQIGQDHQIRLVTPDRPGFFRSTTDPDATFTSVADDLCVLLDHMDLADVGVLGLSGGTAFACTLAARHPDRVSRFGLLGPIAPIDDVGGTEGMDAATRLAFVLGRYAPWLLQGLMTAVRWQTRRNPVTAAEQFTRLRPPPDQDVILRDDVWPILLASFPDVSAAPAADAHEFTLMAAPWPIDPATIAAPTKVWAGGADTVHPPHHAEWLADRIPTATLDVAPHVGIFGWLDDYPRILGWAAGDAQPEGTD